MHMLFLHSSFSIWYQGLHSGKFQLVSTLFHPSVVHSPLLIMNTMSNLSILHSVFQLFQIKGSDRRLATPKSSSSKSKSSSGGGEAVAELVSSTRIGCPETLTRSEFKALVSTSKTATSKSKSNNRRLTPTSKSTSKSSSTLDFKTREVDGCTYRLVASSPKSSSKSSSKDRRRLKPTTSSSSKSKSSGGGGSRTMTIDGITVKCLNSRSICRKCHTESNARTFAFDYSPGSKSKGSSKSNRRLAPTSKSSSKSSSYDHGDDLEVRYYFDDDDNDDCEIKWVRTVYFDSSSTSSSKSKGR